MFQLLSCGTVTWYDFTPYRSPFREQYDDNDDLSNYLKFRFDPLEISGMPASPFFRMSIFPKEKLKSDIKKIIINEIFLKDEFDNYYDLKREIYFINILDYENNKFVEQKKLKDFYNNGSLDISLVERYSGSIIFAKNPRIKIEKVSKVILFFEITVELIDGNIEIIKREYSTKKRIEKWTIIDIFQI
jgi:hypothetical protein